MLRHSKEDSSIYEREFRIVKGVGIVVPGARGRIVNASKLQSRYHIYVIIVNHSYIVCTIVRQQAIVLRVIARRGVG